jgi:NitT/TauT family transport system permease protein
VESPPRLALEGAGLARETAARYRRAGRRARRGHSNMEGAVIRRVMNIVPRQQNGLILAVLPFILIAAIYLVASAERRAVNPDDRLLPPVTEMAQAMHHLAIEPDRRTGELSLWTDTAASLQRLAVGLGLSAFIGLAVGLAIGIVPIINTTLGSLIAVISMIPPMAVLPILFIVFGLGEVSKVALIVFGVAPYLVRDMALAVAGIPREQLIKAQSLGASTWQVALRVVLPQIMPRLIEAVRLSLCSAFLFLISAEAIAADAGLGYRIFLVRRYLAMDVILPYVAWITLLSYAIDFALAQLARRGFAWAYPGDRRQ